MNKTYPITGNPTNPQNATLSAWLMHLPDQHPFWSWYMLSIVHLRDLPGYAPAQKSEPNNTHEVIVLALDPKFTPKPDDVNSIHILTPVNYAEQFVCLSDAQAIEVGSRLVTRFAEGMLLAEPQGIRGARELFGTALWYFVEAVGNGQGDN